MMIVVTVSESQINTRHSMMVIVTKSYDSVAGELLR